MDVYWSPNSETLFFYRNESLTLQSENAVISRLQKSYGSNSAEMTLLSYEYILQQLH